METKLVRIAELAKSDPKRLARFCEWYLGGAVCVNSESTVL
jgi:hypothetical protein